MARRRCLGPAGVQNDAPTGVRDPTGAPRDRRLT